MNPSDSPSRMCAVRRTWTCIETQLQETPSDVLPPGEWGPGIYLTPVGRVEPRNAVIGGRVRAANDTVVAMLELLRKRLVAKICQLSRRAFFAACAILACV